VDVVNNIVPVLGLTCDGTMYFQVSEKMGFGVAFSGIRKLFDFGTNRLMLMQRCRAKSRNPKYVFSKGDLMDFFSVYTPKAWLSALTIPPPGKEFDVFSAKMINEWNNVEISMSTLVSTLLGGDDMLNLGDVSWNVNLSNVDSCTAQEYSTKGCMMEVEISILLSPSSVSHCEMNQRTYL